MVYLDEVIRQDFNISAAAQALDTSQPGVSHQLQTLAEDLGVDLFRHQGKRLVGLTETGEEIATLAADVLHNIKRMREVADAHSGGRGGKLVVVTTRHAASNQLRMAMVRFHEELRGLDVRVFEEEPRSAAAMLMAGDADLGVLSEPTQRSPDLLYFPIEEWRLILVAPRDHALCVCQDLTLARLVGCPLCSYARTASSGQMVDETFRLQGLVSPITLSLGSRAMILEYGEGGVGVGIVGEAAFDPALHPDLRGIDISHLFGHLATDVVLPNKAHVPKYAYDFSGSHAISPRGNPSAARRANPTKGVLLESCRRAWRLCVGTVGGVQDWMEPCRPGQGGIEREIWNC